MKKSLQKDRTQNKTEYKEKNLSNYKERFFFYGFFAFLNRGYVVQ